MNPGEFSVKNNRMVLVAMAIVGGIVAYLNIGRLEDPEITIKQALIITPYPGASAEEVAQEVTNPIEIDCQQMGQLDYVTSESARGRSVVSVHIKERISLGALIIALCMLTDPIFGSMAVCIMFGLSFAAVLSLIVTPMLYAIFFRIKETANAPSGAQ
jgi:multidrug efflux pump subunit AcrB